MAGRFSLAKLSPSWNEQQKERAWKWVQIRFLQVFTVHIWNAKGKRALSNSGLRVGEIQLLENAALESTLMSLRDIDDFFDDVSASKPDDLRVADFGVFAHSGRYLTRTERQILNKALAHLTDFRITEAPEVDTIDGTEAIAKAVNKIEKFLEFLANEFSLTHPHLIEGIENTKQLMLLNLNDLKQTQNGQLIISARLLRG
jgi:hypothetical protein